MKKDKSSKKKSKPKNPYGIKKCDAKVISKEMEQFINALPDDEKAFCEKCLKYMNGLLDREEKKQFLDQLEEIDKKLQNRIYRFADEIENPFIDKLFGIYDYPKAEILRLILIRCYDFSRNCSMSMLWQLKSKESVDKYFEDLDNQIKVITKLLKSLSLRLGLTNL